MTVRIQKMIREILESNKYSSISKDIPKNVKLPPLKRGEMLVVPFPVRPAGSPYLKLPYHLHYVYAGKEASVPMQLHKGKGSRKLFLLIPHQFWEKMREAFEKLAPKCGAPGDKRKRK